MWLPLGLLEASDFKEYSWCPCFQDTLSTPRTWIHPGHWFAHSCKHRTSGTQGRSLWLPLGLLVASDLKGYSWCPCIQDTLSTPRTWNHPAQWFADSCKPRTSGTQGWSMFGLLETSQAAHFGHAGPKLVAATWLAWGI